MEKNKKDVPNTKEILLLKKFILTFYQSHPISSVTLEGRG